MAKGKSRGMKAIIETINAKRKVKAHKASVKYISTLNDDEIAKLLEEAKVAAVTTEKIRARARAYREKMGE